MKRFYFCAKKFRASNIIRVTSDCPLTDPKIIDKFIEIFKNKNVDYLSNGNPPSYPDGFDVEIFKFKALKESFLKSKSLHQKEHVTPYIKKNVSFSKFNVMNKEDLSSLRLTIDYMDDLIVVQKILNLTKKKYDSSYNDIIRVIIHNNKIMKLNSSYTRNSGSKDSENQNFGKERKQLSLEGIC